jgi:hypothetical protein
MQMRRQWKHYTGCSSPPPGRAGLLANRTNKTIQQSIQSMFGEHKIDEDSVKYYKYASQEFYLCPTC